MHRSGITGAGTDITLCLARVLASIRTRYLYEGCWFVATVHAGYILPRGVPGTIGPMAYDIYTEIGEVRDLPDAGRWALGRSHQVFQLTCGNFFPCRPGRSQERGQTRPPHEVRPRITPHARGEHARGEPPPFVVINEGRIEVQIRATNHVPSGWVGGSKSHACILWARRR